MQTLDLIIKEFIMAMQRLVAHNDEQEQLVPNEVAGELAGGKVDMLAAGAGHTIWW